MTKGDDERTKQLEAWETLSLAEGDGLRSIRLFYMTMPYPGPGHRRGPWKLRLRLRLRLSDRSTSLIDTVLRA
jgi:hypothetical protein